MSLEMSDSINAASNGTNGAKAGLLDSVHDTDAKLALKIMRGDKVAELDSPQSMGIQFQERTYGKETGQRIDTPPRVSGDQVQDKTYGKEIGQYIDTPAGKGMMLQRFDRLETLHMPFTTTIGKFIGTPDSSDGRVGIMPNVDAVPSASDDALTKAIEALKR